MRGTTTVDSKVADILADISAESLTELLADLRGLDDNAAQGGSLLKRRFVLGIVAAQMMGKDVAGIARALPVIATGGNATNADAVVIGATDFVAGVIRSLSVDTNGRLMLGGGFQADVVRQAHNPGIGANVNAAVVGAAGKRIVITEGHFVIVPLVAQAIMTCVLTCSVDGVLWTHSLAWGAAGSPLVIPIPAGVYSGVAGNLTFTTTALNAGNYASFHVSAYRVTP